MTYARTKAERMVESWADTVADRIAGDGPPPGGKLLFLGAADTGKTTLMSAVADRLSRSRRVALVDADIGQSHIGPPTTVGWTILDKEGDVDLAPPRLMEGMLDLNASGIGFVGDITPVGHLLQLTAALALCIEQAAQAAEVVLIDTPGLVTGGAACALWWTVQRLLRPERIIAVQRENELDDLLRGLQAELSVIEMVKAVPQLRRKSPQTRQQHRRRLFERYFRSATSHTFDLDRLAVRAADNTTADNAVSRVVGLTDLTGRDVAIGVIERWRREKATATIRAPQLDTQRMRCLTIGNTRIDIPFGRS